MESVTIDEMTANLLQLLTRVEGGAPIVITRGEEPISTFVPFCRRRG